MLSQIAPHSVHPPQSGPSLRSLPSHLHHYYTFVSSLLITWPKAFLGDICGDWFDHCVAPELFIYDSVFLCFALYPSEHFHLLCCSALCSAQHSLPYIKVGLMTVLYNLFFSLTGTFLSQITPDNPLQEFHAHRTLLSTFVSITVEPSGCFYC